MGALEDLKAKIRKGQAGPEDLPLMFRAIEELVRSDADLQAELAEVDDVLVNFQVEGMPIRTHLAIQSHQLKFGAGNPPNAHVTLSVSPEVAGWLASGNMDEVRGAVFSGGFNVVQGDINRSMALLPIFEKVVAKFQA